jgi:hypothetical protein
LNTLATRPTETSGEESRAKKIKKQEEMSYIDFNKYWLRLNEADEAQTGKNTKNPKDTYEYKKEGDKYFFKKPGDANWTPAVKDAAIKAIKDQVTFSATPSTTTTPATAAGAVIGKSKDPNYEFKMEGGKYYYKGKDDKDFIEAKEKPSIDFIKANATFEEPVKGATTGPEVTVTGKKAEAAKVEPATIISNISAVDATNLNSLKTIASTVATQSESITSVDDLRKIADQLAAKLGVTKSAATTAEGIKAYIKSLSDMISSKSFTTANDLTTYLKQNFKEAAQTGTASTTTATKAAAPSAKDKVSSLKQEVKDLRQEKRAEKKVDRLEKKKEKLQGKLANESVVWNFNQFMKNKR